MKRSTRSNSLSSPKTPKPRMYVVAGIVAMLISLSAWSAEQASAVGVAVAAAGDLDPTFGSGGKVVTDFVGGFDTAYALTIQSDGKIVVAGQASSDFALARYNRDGSLDAGFGSAGKITTDFFGGEDAAFSVAVQNDRKIVVAGFATKIGLETRDFALARYESSGSLDMSFGMGGKVTTDFFGDIDEAHGVVVQSDGKIVTAGQARGINPFDFALARYDLYGSLDTNFGLGGKVVTNFGNNNTSLAAKLLLQNDGMALAVGGRWDSLTDYDFALARYNGNGSLDTTFGSGGVVSTTITGNEDVAFGVTLDANGKIIVAGRGSSNNVVGDFALARYEPDGSLDTSFGSSGKIITDFFGGRDEASSIALQSDGKIVAGGVAASASLDFAVARFNTDGSLDASFGMGGKITTDFSGQFDAALAIAIQSDNKVVAAGISNGDFALARYNADRTNFDLCLQDDSNGNLLQFNSTTGDYLFTDCRKGITLRGTGAVTNDPYGCKVNLQDTGPIPKRPDRSVLVQVNRCTHAARASIQIFSSGSSFSITDSDITNNTCACR